MHEGKTYRVCDCMNATFKWGAVSSNGICWGSIWCILPSPIIYGGKKLFVHQSWVARNPALARRTWQLSCEMLVSLSSPLSSRFFWFFFGAFFGPCVPIALKKKTTLCTPAKNDIEIRFPYSTDRFVIRIHNWHFNSFWIQTLQRLVASVSRPTHLIPCFLQAFVRIACTLTSHYTTFVDNYWT